MSEENIVDMIKRMITAFKNVQCFVFEKEEYSVVKKAIDETSIKHLVVIGRADRRYPYILIVRPNLMRYARECEKKAEKAIIEGRVREDIQKYFRIEFIRQCMSHYEHEVVKEIISKLEEYLKEHRGE